MERERLQGLQIGRGLAALTVAYFHSKILFANWPDTDSLGISALLEHGYLGVNFFFAISGYVIAMVCDQKTFDSREFLIKRVFRLYPLFLGIVVFILLLRLVFIKLPTSYQLGPVLYSMTLLPQKGWGFYPVAWSLQYELVFYVMAALLVPWIRLWGLAAILFALTLWAFWFPPQTFTFHLLSTLHSDFLAGLMAYLLRRQLDLIPSSLRIAAGIGGYWVLATQSIPFTGSIGGFFLVSGFAAARWNFSRWPLTWAVKLGDASYSIYMTHMLLAWLIVFALTKSGVGPSAWTAEPIRLAYLAACIALSFWTYRHIEQPGIAKGAAIAAAWRSRQRSTDATPHRPVAS